MNHNETKQIFLTEIQTKINSARKINDGSPENGNTFILTSDVADGVADNLALWWDENYNIDVTLEEAANYLEEVYPEL